MQNTMVGGGDGRWGKIDPPPCRRAGLRPARRNLIRRGKMNLKRGGGHDRNAQYIPLYLSCILIIIGV